MKKQRAIALCFLIIYPRRMYLGRSDIRRRAYSLALCQGKLNEYF
jgi:hypothetical protein